MKKYFFLLVLFATFCVSVKAQVKIGGVAEIPHSSAVLELDGGTTRGLLLPRMRKLDIDAILNPAEGLTIYATDEQAMYLRRSGNWVKMNGSADAFSLPSNNFFSYNSNVLYIQNDGAGTCIGANNTGSGPGIRGFTQTSIGVVGVAQDSLLGIGGSFTNNGGGRALVSNGRTGIGTYFPDMLLHIDGSNTSGSTVLIDDDADPAIEWRKAGINIGNLKFTSTYMETQQKDGAFNWTKTGFQSLMGLRVKPGGLGGVLVATNSIGIGNFGGSYPEASLHIMGTPGDYAYTMIVSQTGADPLIAIRSSGTDKGFIQTVSDDMKIGTFASNDLGKFIVRTNGFDRMFIGPDGKIVMGGLTGNAPAGAQLLKVKGGIQATDFTVTALAAWPDYVFADGYQLKSLEETEAFIKANKHLPNIPAAAVVEKEGFALGEMQKKMMEKIEELTLHLIVANKTIKELVIAGADAKAEITLLKNQANTMNYKN